MLARLFVIVGGLFVLALLLALVGPYFVDWSSYREAFEREASAVLGRKVTVQGTASASILPFPSVTFTDVSVGAGTEGPAMTAETFSMDAELAPLLHGEFLIFDMRLVRPRAVVEVAADGTVDWAIRPSAPFDPGSVAVENLSVTDGEVVIRHGASGREHRLSDIDATLSARALSGPWAGSGTLNFDGHRLSLSGSSGTLERSGVRLRLEAVPDATGVKITTEGRVEVAGGVATYFGSFRAAQVAEADAADEVDPGVGDYRAAGEFSLDDRGITVPQFRFETGPRADPYTAEGKASLTFAASPRFALEARGAQIRLDPAAEADAGSGLPLLQRLTVLEGIARALPQPGIPGIVELNLPALVAGDTTIRDLKLSAEPAEAGWRIRSLAASLPGRTTLEAEGLLGTGDAFGFDGSLLVAVAQPSGFAAWLGRDVDGAVRGLPSAGFSAKVKLGPERQSFADLELVLGNASLRGSADSRTPSERRPSLALRLGGGQLDLAQADALASLLIGQSGLSGLAGRDIDLALKAGPLRAGGFTADGVDAALRLGEAGLAVDRLALTGVAGAAIDGAGSFSGTPDARKGAITATVKAADLQPLLTAAAARFPENGVLRRFAARAEAFPGLLADADLRLSLRSEPAGSEGPQVVLQVEGAVGGSELGLSLVSRTWLADWGKGEMRLEASARNADAAPLLALSGLHAAPLGLTGPADLTLSANGVPSAGMAARAALRAKKFSASFEGRVSPDASGGLAFNGPVALDAVDIEPWLMTLGTGLPGFGLGTPADLKAEADYADGLLVFSGVTGSLDEEAVAGSVNIALRNGLPEITGELALDDFDLAWAASVLLGEAAFDEEPDGRMTTPFRKASLAPFSAGFSVSAGTLHAGALATLYDADFTLSLNAERIALGALTATYRDGRLKGSAELKNGGGTGELSAQFDLKGAEVAAAARNASLAARGDLSGSVSASGGSIDALIAGLNGAGTASLRDLSVAGLNGAALPRLLAKGDRAGAGLDGAAVERFAPPVLRDGSFRGDRADFAFTVNGGVLRTPPFAAAGASADLSLALRADLGARTVSVQGRFDLAPGREGLVGSEPAVGVTLEGGFGAAALRLDTAPLAQFLVQRTLEREQARVEELQNAVLEKQRLRREARYYQALEAERQRQSRAARVSAQARAALEAERAALRLAETERTRQAVPQPASPQPVPSPRGLAPADAAPHLNDQRPQ